ncbi:MAG: TRAP transporter small permease subunit [Acidobacteria bacterium]|nr:TRAP transporter small permease subunit [Acidobacteriota bacterium]
MPSYVSRVLEVIDAASEWTGRISAFLIPGMMLIMTYEVVARYILKRPTTWAMESTQYLFLATTALGGAYVLLHGGHVNVPILYARLSTRTQAIVDVVTSLFFFFFMIALFRVSWMTTVESVVHLEHSPTYWGPPIYPVYIVMTAGILLTILQGLAKLVRDFATAITGKVERSQRIARTPQDELR